MGYIKPAKPPKSARKVKPGLRFCKAPHSAKVKKGGVTVVSEALVKKGRTNLVPKVHVKRGDLVMVVSGSEKLGRGKTGKVLKVIPKTGKVIVEGINMVSHHTKKSPMGQGGIVVKEAPIFACKVMLFDPESKKPVRKEFRKKLSL